MTTGDRLELDTSTLKTEEIKIRITPSLRRSIDEVRGDESVSSLVRAALRCYFDELRTRRTPSE